MPAADTRRRSQASGGPSGAALAVIVLTVALSIAAPKFLSFDNFQVIAYSVANLAVVAFAQMVVLAAGGMDLSVGAIGGLTAVIVGGLMEVWQCRRWWRSPPGCFSAWRREH